MRTRGRTGRARGRTGGAPRAREGTFFFLTKKKAAATGTCFIRKTEQWPVDPAIGLQKGCWDVRTTLLLRASGPWAGRIFGSIIYIILKSIIYIYIYLYIDIYIYIDIHIHKKHI